MEGAVRVTAVETLASRLLLPAFRALQLGNPEIGIELPAYGRHASLAMREADIAVRLTRFQQHDLGARRIGTMTHGLCASPAYLERHGAPACRGSR
nr:LysR substrate-binding domain-containing protein [Roseicella aerolata]